MKKTMWKTSAALALALIGWTRFAEDFPTGDILPEVKPPPPPPPPTPTGGFPINTMVEYLPAGKTKWSEAVRGRTSSLLVSGDKVSRSPNFLYYSISGVGPILAQYVRRVATGL